MARWYRDDAGACPELLSVHGIKDHYVNELCAEFRRRIRRFTLPLRYGHLVPTCSLVARPRATHQLCILLR